MPDTRRELSALQTLYADNTAGDISAQDLRDGVQSVHGSQLGQTAARASRPGSPLTGDLFFPSDSFYLERYSGSAWAQWGPLFPLTEPVSGNYAWINQGSASVATTNGGVLLSCPSAAADSLKIRKKTAPSTPYKIDAVFFVGCDLSAMGSQANTWGLCFRQSSDGKLVTFATSASVGGGVTTFTTAIGKWTDATTFSAAYTPAASPTSSIAVRLMWWRIEDDGSNRKCSFSTDGQNWSLVHSVGRTDFLTADEVGFFINPRNTSLAMNLVHWKES